MSTSILPAAARRTFGHRALGRRMMVAAWTFYPPLALLVIAMLFLSAGCSQTRPTSAADPIVPDAQLATAEIDGQSPVADEVVPGDETNAVEIDEPAQPVATLYPSGSPVLGTAAARATVQYGRNKIELANLGQLPWTSGRVWINRTWSVQLPHTKAGKLRRLDFGLFRDASGRPFPKNNQSVRVERLELQLGDEITRIRYGLGI